MTNDVKIPSSTAAENGNKMSERSLLLQLPVDENVAGSGLTRRVENVRNCDIFVDDFHVLIYADVRLLRFNAPRQLDTLDMKKLVVKFNSQERCYKLELPCMPHNLERDGELQPQAKKEELDRKSANDKCSNSLDLWKLKRITEDCQLQLDNHAELVGFEANFDYGFASKFKGKIRSGECDLSAICRMPEPNLTSPLQRSIDREIDELKNFCRDQYKLNFVELQVPEGHDNPMKFAFNFDDSKLTSSEECLLHNLTCKPEYMQMPDSYDQAEVDCGLISLLLPICYDIRSTMNEPTCESAWTRSILSSLLTYFEPCDSVKEVIVSFLRRSLIYPLYRNYDFGRLCVQDAIDVLQRDRAWILKQLLLTHELFVCGENGREVFNNYYIEDYIRYVSSEVLCPATHLQMLAHNLKNVLLDVYKRHLRLDLAQIETELLKELITDIHIGAASSTSEEDSEVDDDAALGENDDDDDDGTESGEDESEASATSESDENSVIEQRLNSLTAS